jgi:hypothetical protein
MECCHLQGILVFVSVDQLATLPSDGTSDSLLCVPLLLLQIVFYYYTWLLFAGYALDLSR